MGHEVIIYGVIESVMHFNNLLVQQENNRSVLGNLPATDEWPWLTRSMFTVPESYPRGIYHTPVIHFGLSMKDDAPAPLASTVDGRPEWPMRDRECVDGWIARFEALLRKLYWIGANVHISTEFETPRVLYYTATTAAINKMIADDPQPIQEWDFRIAFVP